MAQLTYFVLLALLGGCLGNPVVKSFGAKPNNRIVNGEVAKKGDFPYQVSLQDHFFGHFCGGSILNQKWILTAAHCLIARNSFYTVVGVMDWSNLGSDGSKHEVDEVIIHPDFDISKPTFDLGLIKIKDSITYSANVKNINLPSSDLNTKGLSVVASGWGKLSTDGELPRKLQCLHMEVYDNESCVKRMLEVVHTINVTEKNICTLAKDGSGLCHGDSGGPIVAGDVQVGIVSWGWPCAQGYPDVNIHVWSHADWIRSYINKQ